MTPPPMRRAASANAGAELNKMLLIQSLEKKIAKNTTSNEVKRREFELIRSFVMSRSEVGKVGLRDGRGLGGLL